MTPITVSCAELDDEKGEAGHPDNRIGRDGRSTMKVLCAAGYFLSGGLLLTILLSLPGVASAGGVGGYLEFWRGDQTIEFDVVDQDFTNNRFGLGVVLDTSHCGVPAHRKHRR
ncbi:MAG: hypothetical protein JRG94_10130 [Deltaproteobacteria bacterium]|nr:hypothetical protein [Deltaproteobacteria bacterium]